LVGYGAFATTTGDYKGANSLTDLTNNTVEPTVPVLNLNEQRTTIDLLANTSGCNSTSPPPSTIINSRNKGKKYVIKNNAPVSFRTTVGQINSSRDK